jgi:hypothetical protein
VYALKRDIGRHLTPVSRSALLRNACRAGSERGRLGRARKALRRPSVGSRAFVNQCSGYVQCWSLPKQAPTDAQRYILAKQRTGTQE